LVELIEVSIQEKREKKKINAYAGKPARIESKSILQIQIHLNEQAIASRKKLAGWQVYATTISQRKLSFEKVVWKYRQQKIK